MNKKIWLIVLLFSALPFMVQAQTCICYDTGGDCTEVTLDDADGDGNLTDSDCDTVCQSNLHSEYENFDFSDDPDTEAELTQTCEEQQETAEATTSTQTTATYSLIQGESSKNFINPILNVDIPGISFSQVLEENGYIEVNFLAEYISGIYKYLLAIAAIFAVMMIMVGGIQYIISPGGKGGKERINNAVIGLILLFSVYLILFTVNPETTIFSALKLKLTDPVFYIEKSGDTAGGVDTSGERPSAIQCSGSGDVATIARSFIGNVSYRMGGKGGPAPYPSDIETCGNQPCKDFCPDNTLCLDCSGFVAYVSQCAGLPAVAGGTAQIFASAERITSCNGNNVTLESGQTVVLTAGDLLGFKAGDYSAGKQHGHIFMYIGDGKIVDSAGSGRASGQAVSEKNLSWACDNYPLRLVDR